MGPMGFRTAVAVRGETRGGRRGREKERSLGIAGEQWNLRVCAHTGWGVNAGIRASRAALKSNPAPFFVSANGLIPSSVFPETLLFLLA